MLHAFTSGIDGSYPVTVLNRDEAGSFYGTTVMGGTGQYGSGTVFKLAPDGTETVLHAFQGGEDGVYPGVHLARDEAGNLYGTTRYGGGSGCDHDAGCGVIFKLAPGGNETVLYAFSKHPHHGSYPAAGLIEGRDDRVYGTAAQGGARCGCGTVFRLGK